jgi:hypothetical protein
MGADCDLKMKLVGFMISILIVILFIFCQNNNVYAHKFYNNQASILFSFVESECSDFMKLQNTWLFSSNTCMDILAQHSR